MRRPGPSHSTARLCLTAAVVLSIAGCAAGPQDESGSAEEVGGASGGGFCTEFEAAGGSGTTVGPIQVWVGRDEVLADVGERLTVMNAVEAPADVEAQWNAMKAHYEAIQADFEAADPNAGDPVDSQGESLVGKFSGAAADLQDDYETVTDYYFATC